MKLSRLLQRFSTKRCTVLWPEFPPSSVYEEAYAQRFCFKRIKSLTNNIVFYNPEEKWENISLPEETETVIVFTDPYTYLSESAFSLLTQSCRKNTANLPVYTSGTKNPDQLVSLPFPYVDPISFEEAASHMAQSNKTTPTSIPDLACFTCFRKDLPKVKSGNIEFVVNTGALAHRFVEMFSSPREDLVKLIPKNACLVLDVGCATGGFGKKLMETKKDVVIDGVEMDPLLAQKAQEHYRKVFTGKFEDADIPEGQYDAICMGDVLEHMYDPWKALHKANRLLKSRGVLVGSVPNAAHWSIIRQLIAGRFDYIPLGLLCVSHIRFFTPYTLKEALQDAGFKVETLDLIPIPPTPEAEKLINALKRAGVDPKLLKGAEILFSARKP